MSALLKAFQYRLYPTKVQLEALGEMLETCRHLYNRSLVERRDAYQNAGKSLNYYDQANTLKEQAQDQPLPCQGQLLCDSGCAA